MLSSVHCFKQKVIAMSSKIESASTAKTAFENATDVLQNEIMSMEKSLTNFNALYGIPSIESLSSCFSSEESLIEWIFAEHPELLKLPTCCPVCNKQLQVDKKAMP